MAKKDKKDKDKEYIVYNKNYNPVILTLLIISIIFSGTFFVLYIFK